MSGPRMEDPAHTHCGIRQRGRGAGASGVKFPERDVRGRAWGSRSRPCACAALLSRPCVCPEREIACLSKSWSVENNDRVDVYLKNKINQNAQDDACAGPSRNFHLAVDVRALSCYLYSRTCSASPFALDRLLPSYSSCRTRPPTNYRHSAPRLLLRSRRGMQSLRTWRHAFRALMIGYALRS